VYTNPTKQGDGPVYTLIMFTRCTLLGLT